MRLMLNSLSVECRLHLQVTYLGVNSCLIRNHSMTSSRLFPWLMYSSLIVSCFPSQSYTIFGMT